MQSGLDYVAFAYNSTTHLATKFTPNFLQFGRELCSSLNLLLPKPTATYESHGQYAAEVSERAEVAYELAREFLNTSAELAKRMYDKKLRPQSFNQGDKVFIYSPRKFKNKNPKWQRKYAAECKVVSKLNDASYIVYDVQSKHNRIVHVDKMRLLSRDNEENVEQLQCVDSN